MATESQIALYENFKAINTIETASYDQFDVKRGLRNADGTGVLAGMTNISNVHGYVMSDGEKMPAEARCACAATISTTFWAIWIRRAASPSRRWPICCSWASCDPGAPQPLRGSDRFPARAARRLHRQHAYGGHLARPHEHDGPFHPAPVRGRRVRRGPLAGA